MQSSSLSTSGQTPPHNPSGIGTNPIQPSHGDPTTASASSISVSGTLPLMVNGQSPGSQRSVTPTFPVPQRHGTEPTARTPPTTYPLRPILSAPSFPVPVVQLLGGPPGGSSLQQQVHGSSADKEKALFESLVYAEGEIPLFDKDEADSWRLIRSEPVVKRNSLSFPWYKIWKIFSSSTSWTDAQGILLDTHFFVVETQTNSTGANKSTLVFKPIALENLSLASFDDEPEEREYHIGFFKQIGSCVHLSPGAKKDQVYPFTIYHVAAKITRRHTIYTNTKTERNKWNAALDKAIESRKSQLSTEMLYTPQIFNDGFFKVPPRIRLNREARYTGRVACAALFLFQWEEFQWGSRGSQRENYIAIGCTDGIFVSKRTERTEDYSFRRILEFNEPRSIVAIPEFNRFLVHCESTLSSFPLDKVIRASRAVQGDAAIKDLGDSEEKLSKDEEHVLFLKAGRLVEKTADPDQTIDRVVVIYAVKSSEKITSHVLELERLDSGGSTGTGTGASRVAASVKYLPLGPSIDIPEEPHDATCLVDKVAICTPKAVYFVEPLNPTKTTYDIVPKIAEEAHKKSKLPKLLQREKKDKRKIVELVGNASVLGMVAYEKDHDFLLVYDSLGCFVDKAGNLARTDFYYVEWERKATTFAFYGLHLLLFSPGYIEVRKIDTGKLFRMVEINDLRILRSGLTEGRSLIGVMTGGADADGSRPEKLLELVYHGNN